MSFYAYTDIGGVGSFTVVKSNPADETVKFTITDTNNLLTRDKDVRAVLCDAIDQWITSERADLDTNGDSAVKGSDEYAASWIGQGFSQFTFNYSGKYATVDLTALTNISVSGNLTAAIPFADVI